MRDPKRIRRLGEYGEVQLIDSMPGELGAGDQRVVDSARVSILGEAVKPVSTNPGLINYLVKHEHWTPLESVKLTVRVKAPIFIARQWMRHRTWSFNEQSARYGVIPYECYVPTLQRVQAGGQAKDNKQGSGEPIETEKARALQCLMDIQCKEAYLAYEALIESGLARELARSVLPQGMYTQFYGSVDLRNLLGFCKLRIHEHAQLEIRGYATHLMDIAHELAPLTVNAYRKHWLTT